MLKAYERIRELRKESGWSQAELAEKVGYADKSMISRIENGKIDLKLPQLEEFAKVFGVPSSELVGDVGEEDAATYFLDDFARELAQFIHDNPEYRTAFSAARKVHPEDLEAIIAIINKNKGVQ